MFAPRPSLLALLAANFLAAVVFGNPRPASYMLRRWRLTQRHKAQAAAIVGLGLLATCFAAPAAVAQGTPGKQVVTIGFRADAEPFSYRVRGDGGKLAGDQPLYRGFLADLCYWIFDGGDYSVVESEVTAGNRFEKLMSREIDVLCDPVTMRFSDEDRTRAGTFVSRGIGRTRPSLTARLSTSTLWPSKGRAPKRAS